MTMEPVEVTARFDLQGKPIPLSFTWEGNLYQVDATGRRWENEGGQHILVMIPGGKVFELLFTAPDGRWFLKPTGPGRAFV